MYEIFEKLIKEKGITAYRVAKETGLGTSTFSDWKIGRSAPKIDKLKKIADYLEVDIDYLTGISSDRSINKTTIEKCKYKKSNKNSCTWFCTCRHTFRSYRRHFGLRRNR